MVPLKCVKRSILEERATDRRCQRTEEDQRSVDEEGESVIPLAEETLIDVPRFWTQRGLYV